MRSFYAIIGLTVFPLFGLLLLVSCGVDPYSVKDYGEGQPEYSQDTLRLDTLYSRISSATKRLIVYNRHNKPLLLEDIRLENSPLANYRLNVDGRSGTEFQDITIFAKDSIFLFVEATFPEGNDDLPTQCDGVIHVRCNGIESKVLLEGFRLNIDHENVLIVTSDRTIKGKRPLFIRDSIFVAKGATLRLEPSAHLLMSDKAKIIVEGTLLCEGTPEQRILIEGVRRDDLVDEVNYRLIPGQWEQICFKPGSHGNRMLYSTIRNGRGGVIVGEAESTESCELFLEGCHIANMKGNALKVANAEIEAVNSLFANTLASTIELWDASVSLQYCTVAGFYPFDRRLGSAIHMQASDKSTPPHLTLSHSVVEGSFEVIRETGKAPAGGEISFDYEHPTWITVSYSYLRSPLEIFQYSEGCLEASVPADSVFHSLGKDLETQEYHFHYDFRPVIGAPFTAREKKSPLEETPSVDLNGIPRKNPTSWGAFEAVPREESPENAYK